jgi:hypothetical protein
MIMNYKDGVKKLFPIVKEVWQKIDSGFYPEIDQEFKLIAIQNMVNAGCFRDGFWELFDFLIKDLFAMSQNLLEEKKKTANILRALDDKEVVCERLEKLNKAGILDPIIASGIL